MNPTQQQRAAEVQHAEAIRIGDLFEEVVEFLVGVKRDDLKEDDQ